MKPFANPGRSLGTADAQTLARLALTSADLALALDADGVITDIAFANADAAPPDCLDWVGRRWHDTVTEESRPKVPLVLADADDAKLGRARQLNHPMPHGADLPMLYTATRLGGTGKHLLMGRDLRPVSELQQRLIEAQQSMEREYGRLRNLETRYRMLFEVATEAVLIVDQGTERIIEANPAAEQLLGEGLRRVVGRPFPEGFDGPGTQALLTMLASARATGRGERVRVATVDGRGSFAVSAFMFRQDGQGLFLVRLAPIGESGGGRIPRDGQRMLALADRSPDGSVVLDREGRILSCNPAFLELLQVPTLEQARGQSLARWLGRTGVELEVLLASIRQSGQLRFYASTVRGEFGASADVEISGVTLDLDGEPALGLMFRNVGLRLPSASSRDTATPMPRSVEQLSELVGRVSLKELVREATDMIERLCIEAALELTNDNRASAAELLGVSRQSLYVKLRRYGIAEGEVDAPDPMPERTPDIKD